MNVLRPISIALRRPLARVRRGLSSPALLAISGSLLLASLPLAGSASAQIKPLAARVSVDERVGETLPLDTKITDENGKQRTLGEFFEPGKPVLLALAYYHCISLCDVSLRSLAKTMRQLGWTLGDDFHALTISIDPHDTPPIAAKKRSDVLRLAKTDDPRVWPFFVSTQDQIEKLAAALGYHYDYDPGTKQYAHPAVSFVITPKGKIARYIYGPTTELRSLRLALREARLGRGGVSSLIDRTVLSCFHYDPSTHRYELVITSVMRGGAAAIAVALAIAVLIFTRRGRRRRHVQQDAHSS